MNRQLAGLLVVLVAIVGAAVAGTSGARLAGRAAVVDFPGAPAVGACLIDPLDEDIRFPFERNRQVPQYGTCADHRTLGEVVAVGSPAPVDLRPGLDETIGCRSEALIQAGLVRRDDGFGIVDSIPEDPVRWDYSIAATTGWIGQIPWSPRASAWAVCLVRPVGLSMDVDPLARSFNGGPLPDEYGTCWKSQSVDAAMKMIDCALPHAAELIAVGRIEDATLPWQRFVDSCTEQARLVMRRDDPTVGGQLTVRVQPDGVTVSRRTRNLTCFVTAADNRLLMGSMIGLGSDQVRFAG